MIALDFDYQAVHYQTHDRLPDRPDDESRYLSQDQVDHLAGILRDIPGLLEDLEIATVKDVRFPARTPDGDGTEAPIPFNPAAADAQRRLTQAVCGAAALLWHRVVSGMARPVWDATEAAQWLHGQLDQLALDPQAEESATELDRAARRALRIVDRPPDPKYSGECPQCGEDLHAEPGTTHITCACGCTTSRTDLREQAMERGAPMLFTIAQLTRFDIGRGHQPTKDQLNGYVRRKRLFSPQANRDGTPMYRLGDVRRLILRA